MPKLNNSVPDRWEQYSPVGSQILGTRLIAFKTPLKETICAKLELKSRFSVEMLVKKIPDLGLIIDLTNTNRYYNSDEVLKLGVAYAKVACPGQTIPPENIVSRFFSAIDTFLDKHPNDGKLIGVHCTHGVNRTGYLLSRYLIQRMGFKVGEAVDCVVSARGHPIERLPYIDDLREHVVAVSRNTRSMDIADPRKPATGGGRRGEGSTGGGHQQQNNWRNPSSRSMKMPENTGRRREISPDGGRPVKKSRFDSGGSSQPLPEPWSVKPPILQEASIKADTSRQSDGGGGRSGRNRPESSRFRDDAGFQFRSSEIPLNSSSSTSFSHKSRYAGLKEPPTSAPPAPTIPRDVYVPRPSDFEKSRTTGNDRGDRFEEPRSRRRSVTPPRREIPFEENHRGRDRKREVDRDRDHPPVEPRRERGSPVEPRRDGGFRDRSERVIEPEGRRSPSRVDTVWSDERRRRDPSPDFADKKGRYERDLEPPRHRYEDRPELEDPSPLVWEDKRIRGRSPRRSVSPRSRANFTSDRIRHNRSPEPIRVRRPPSPHMMPDSPRRDRFENEPSHSRAFNNRRSPSPPLRGQSPPRGRSPLLRGQSPPRGRSPLLRGQSPPRGRSPLLRGQSPPRGRSPPLRGQSPPRGRSPRLRGRSPLPPPFRGSRDGSPYTGNMAELLPRHRRPSPPSSFDPPRRTRSPPFRRSRSPDTYNRPQFSPQHRRSPPHFRGPPPNGSSHRRRSPAHFRAPPSPRRSRSPRSPGRFREPPHHMARSRSPRSPAHFRGPPLSPPRAYRSRSISPRRIPNMEPPIRERIPEIMNRPERYRSRSPGRAMVKRGARERSPQQQHRPQGRNRSPPPRGHRFSPPPQETSRRDYNPMRMSRERSPRPRDLSPPLEHYSREPPLRLTLVPSPSREFVELRLSQSPPLHIRRRLEPTRHFRSRSPPHIEPADTRIVMASSPSPPPHFRNQHRRSPPPHRFLRASPPPVPLPHHTPSLSPRALSRSPPPAPSFHDRPLSLSPSPREVVGGGDLPLDVPDCRILINQKRLESSLTDPDESVFLRDDSLNDMTVGPHRRHHMQHHHNRRDRKPVFDRLDKKRAVFDRLDPGARRGNFRRNRR